MKQRRKAGKHKAQEAKYSNSREYWGKERVRFAARGKMVVACVSGHSPTTGVGWMILPQRQKKLSLAALLRLALRCDARARRASQRRRIRNTGPFVSG
jgi:hypothetical protein